MSVMLTYLQDPEIILVSDAVDARSSGHNAGTGAAVSADR